MSIKGLGINKQPFLYLDEYMPEVDWDLLHSDISLGLASCQWVKRFVSAGVHPNWAEKEIATHIIERKFNTYQQELFDNIDRKDTETRLKFASLVTTGLHPFWSCYLRLNKPVDITGISNKTVAADCQWTDNIKHFPTLMSLIEQMPFQEIGRVMFFITEPNNETVPHFDNTVVAEPRPNDDFIYFSTLNTSAKKIYVMDSDTLEKYYPTPGKKFLWFNEMDYHGTDATDRLTFSVRIEGKFTPEVKEKLIIQ